MAKYALFPFNGEPTCFVHVLLNALDLHGKGHEVRIVVEGMATTLLPKLEQEGHPLHKPYGKARELGLLAGACRACSAKLGVLDSIQALGLPLLDDMQGHPGMAPWLEQGYQIITF